MGIDIEERSHGEGQQTTQHDDDEEHSVAHGLRQSARKESGKHHRKGHEACAQSIVRGFVLPLTEINHKEHIGTEAETVAEILEEHARINGHQVLGHRISQIHIGDVGNGDGTGHRPQPAFQSVAACKQSADNAFR